MSVRQNCHQVRKSAPIETCITDASHAACTKCVIGIAPVSTPVDVGTSGSIQDVAISVLSSGWPDLSEESLTRVGETSIAASSGSTSGVADQSSSWSLDLSEEPMTRVGPAGSTPPSDQYLSGSLDLSAESMTRGGSAVSTVPFDRVTMSFVVLRLVRCCLGDGSEVLLCGYLSSGMISLRRPWELDILFEMLVGK